MAGHFRRFEKLLSAACEAAAFTPGFAQFAGFARAAGRPLYIASDGFGFYIKPILKQHGYLEYITAIYSNNLRLGDNGRVTIEIPYANHRCSVCGNCKAAHVCSLKEEGYRVVYIATGSRSFARPCRPGTPGPRPWPIFLLLSKWLSPVQRFYEIMPLTIRRI